MVVATVLGLTGCAGPGNAGEEPQERVTVVFSATAAASAGVIRAPLPASPARAAIEPAPARPGEASCALGATPTPSLDPSASFDMHDPQERARRTLAQQHRPTPRRGTVPAAAVAGAEACVHALKIHFSLLAAGSATVPDPRAIATALRSAGLTDVTVRSGPAFAASTGAACVHGTFTTAGPAFTIGPPATDGSCRP